MTKEEKKSEPRPKRAEFKPDIRSATAIIGAIAFLQKTGFAATPKNIRTCISQRCRKPATRIMETLPNYLTRGLELGILRRFNGVYKLGRFDIRKRKRNRHRGQQAKKTKSIKSSEKSVMDDSVAGNNSVGVC